MDGSDSEAPNQNPDPIQPQNFLVIRDDYFVDYESPVFPPTHHEDLPLPAPDESESPSPAVSDFRSRAVGEAIMSCFEILKAKVISGISGFGSYAATARRCSVLPVTAMAALLVVSLFLLKMKMKMRLPWRSRTVAGRTDNQHRLLLLLKHKDEKISQLLVQIAQMNETLSARRRVPVVRIK